MRLLLEYGCDINAANNDGRTALSFAAAPSMKRAEKPEAVNVLLNSAANHLQEDSRGFTAEDWAVRENRWSTVAVLRDHRWRRERSTLTAPASGSVSRAVGKPAPGSVLRRGHT